MVTEQKTPMATTECGHLEFLTEHGVIRFGLMLNMENGKSRMAPLMDQLKEGKDGMLRVTKMSTHILIHHCPLCGEKVAEPQP